jgi:hypothetical protein
MAASIFKRYLSPARERWKGVCENATLSNDKDTLNKHVAQNYIKF